MNKKELREMTLKELELELGFMDNQEVIVTLDTSVVGNVKNYRSFNAVAVNNNIILSEQDFKTEDEFSEGLIVKEDNIYRFTIDRDDEVGFVAINIRFKDGSLINIETYGTVLEGVM